MKNRQISNHISGPVLRKRLAFALQGMVRAMVMAHLVVVHLDVAHQAVADHLAGADRLVEEVHLPEDPLHVVAAGVDLRAEEDHLAVDEAALRPEEAHQQWSIF
jgi:hypothetical protein